MCVCAPHVFVTCTTNCFFSERSRRVQRLQIKEKGTRKNSAGMFFFFSTAHHQNVFIENKILSKCDSLLSTGFPGTVWQDRGLYFWPPIKDSVKKSGPRRVELYHLPGCFSVSNCKVYRTLSAVEQLFIYCWCGACEKKDLSESQEADGLAALALGTAAI